MLLLRLTATKSHHFIFYNFCCCCCRFPFIVAGACQHNLNIKKPNFSIRLLFFFSYFILLQTGLLLMRLLLENVEKKFFVQVKVVAAACRFMGLTDVILFYFFHIFMILSVWILPFYLSPATAVLNVCCFFDVFRKKFYNSLRQVYFCAFFSCRENV